MARSDHKPWVAIHMDHGVVHEHRTKSGILALMGFVKTTKTTHGYTITEPQGEQYYIMTVGNAIKAGFGWAL